MNDGPNEPGSENSSRTYLLFLLDILQDEETKGVIEKDIFQKLVWDNYHQTFSADDLRPN